LQLNATPFAPARGADSRWAVAAPEVLLDRSSDPIRRRASNLIGSGPYRLTRNPMHVTDSGAVGVMYVGR